LQRDSISAGSGISVPFFFGFYYSEQHIKEALEKAVSPPMSPATLGWPQKNHVPAAHGRIIHE